MDNIDEVVDNIILDFSTLEEEIEIPDLKDDPDKTIDLSDVINEIKGQNGE